MANVQINGNLNLQFQQTGTGILLGVSPIKQETLKSIMQTSGTLLDQCDTLHMATYTFVASTTQTIDLIGGTLLDIYGQPAIFARVKLFLMKFLGTTNGQKLILGAAGSNEWSGTSQMLGATGSLLNVLASTANNDGYVVVGAPNTTGYVADSTHKILKMDPGSGAFSVELIIAGCSA